MGKIISNEQLYKYIVGKFEITEFFKNRKDSLVILGMGFDPRMCEFLQCIQDVSEHFKVLKCDYDNSAPKKGSDIEKLCNNNKKKLNHLCSSDNIISIEIPQFSNVENEKKLIISNSVDNVITKELIKGYSNIIIDISAMPRTVAFSIIRRLLHIKTDQKLYVIVCENSQYDDQLKVKTDDRYVQYLEGFNTFQFTQESEAYNTVWFPALGNKEEEAFETISNFISPVEICPIVPFPSADISRGEMLLRQYGVNLFRDRDVDPRNIIYVPEKYPALIFHILFDTVKYYDRAFNVDGGISIRYAFSSQSSKLIDLGILLAILALVNEDIPVGFAALEDRKYFDGGSYDNAKQELYCLCLDDDELDW